MNRTRVLLICGLVLAGGVTAQVPPAPQPAPTPASTFSTEIEQVLVDVVVTDKQGAPVTGLSKADFTVSEDGAPQAVVTFEAVELKPGEAAPDKPPAPVSTNQAAEASPDAGRTFVVVFDDVHLTPFQARQAKAAVAQFLQRGAAEGDRATIVSTSGAAWWSARLDARGRQELLGILKRLEGRLIPDNSPDRVSDYEAMRIYTFNDQEVQARVRRRFESRGVAPKDNAQTGSDPTADPYVHARASDVYFQALNRNRLTLEVIERLLLAMQGVRGRKSLIMVSQGFIYDPNMDEFKRVVQASRRGNAAIYFVNARGLEGMPSDFTAEFGPAIDERDLSGVYSESFEATAGSDSLAGDTGGFVVRNTNDLGSGIRRIADETRAYYLLGYSSTNAKRDGRFRKIQVKLERKGLTVRARKGYYAPLEGGAQLAKVNKGGPDPVLQAAIDSPFDAPDIGLRMSAFVGEETLLGKANTVVVADVDVGRFAFEERDGRFLGQLEFMLVVAHRETGEFLRYDQTIDMKLLPATRERLRAQWFPLARDFELAPGGYQAKLVVRDKASGRVGTLVHNFDVPALGDLRLSSPILTDLLQATPPDQPRGIPVPQPVARRAFPTGSTLYCSFEVYGAQRAKENNLPRVAAGYVIRRADGVELTHANMSEIRTTSLGRVSRLIGAPLEGAAPGEYELVISVKDELSGRALERREPFTIVAPPPAAAPDAK